MYIAKLLSTFLLLIHCYSSYTTFVRLHFLSLPVFVHLPSAQFSHPHPPAPCLVLILYHNHHRPNSTTHHSNSEFFVSRSLVTHYRRCGLYHSTAPSLIHIINFIESISVGICLVRSFHVFFHPYISFHLFHLLLNIYFCAIIWQIT